MSNSRELRERLERERQAGRGRAGRGFSSELRQLVSEYVEDERRKGQPWAVVAETLGLAVPTLLSWAGRNTRKCAFKPVVVVEGSRASARNREPITLLGPFNTRVTGLDLDDVVELWRRLGC